MKNLNSFTAYFPQALLFLLMFPLLFININNFHDWGDDFAQYILQAQWMAGSIPEIPVTDVSGYSPGKKGLFFSVLLLPSVFSTSQTIFTGKIIVTLSLMFCGMMFFRYLNQKFNPSTALITTLFLVYNVHMLRLKDQVLPDLLFTGIVLLVFVMINSKKHHHIIIAFLLAGLTTGLKSSGFALIFAILILLFFQTPEVLKRIKFKSLIALLLPCLVILFLETFLSSEKSGAGWYASVTITNFHVHTMAGNFETYTNALGLFFEQELPLWANTIIRYFVFTGFVGGCLLHLKRNTGPMVWFVVIYVVFLILYPYDQDPVRFIVPLVPFILFLVLDFYNEIAKVILSKKTVLVPFIISLAFASSQVLTAKNEIQREYTYAPWSEESREMIAYVRQHIDNEKVISFHKPWALAFFTQKHCVPVTAAYKADYLIFNTTQVNPVDFDQSAFAAITFKNNNYVVIKSK